MVEVYGTPVRPSGHYQRPFQGPIRAAMTSPWESPQALVFAGFPTPNNVRHFSGICAARSGLMTPPTRRACSWRARLVPETRSACSENRTRGMQHKMPRTRAHVGTRVFQIHLTLASILAVRLTVFSNTWDVPAPDSLHEDTRARAAR